MSGRRIRWGLGTLAFIAVFVLVAPLFGLRDVGAQPDTTVLRNLPPLARPHLVLLQGDARLYANEIREAADGSLEVRRGSRWKAVDRERLRDPVDWHRRPFYPFGTDGLGRDLFSRIVHGGRVSLAVGFLAALVSLLVGTSIGATAGLAGGWVDAVLMRFTDMTLAIPRLFLAVLLVALFGGSIRTTVIVLGTTTWMAAARLVRGEILSLRDREFVNAARAGGASPLRLGVLHVLPGAMLPLLVEGALRVGDSILLEASLSFLGVGVQPPLPSWGNIIADGRGALIDAWWIAALPGIAIAVTVVALHLAGDGLRDLFRESTGGRPSGGSDPG